MHTFELFLLEEGTFGYRIYQGERLATEQSFAPGIGGRVPMSESEATAYAKADIIAADDAVLAAEADAASAAAAAAEAPPDPAAA